MGHAAFLYETRAFGVAIRGSKREKEREREREREREQEQATDQNKRIGIVSVYCDAVCGTTR